MSKPHIPQEHGAETLPTQPGHVMPREHYEGLLREAMERQDEHQGGQP